MGCFPGRLAPLVTAQVPAFIEGLALAHSSSIYRAPSMHQARVLKASKLDRPKALPSS